MAIPESQLSTWSHHGAQDSSKRTHEAIRRVLDAHQWPTGMTRNFYLKGSYRNDTNIRGDSDVDVVLELTSSFDHDASTLSKYEQGVLNSSFQPATYSWNDFRRETLKALEGGFGKGMVAQGNKNRLQSTGGIRSDLAPSDFVECLLFNAPDWMFQTSFQETYCSIVNWVGQSGIDELACQNGQQWLFGPPPEQWSVADAKAFANQLAHLWNDWE
ncbi:MAG: nucleotidyltransferase [Chloroflexota bacterium]|nr:nucleotidyltransferase [Chloroflexota bacterium]MDE2886534.1 nucleotidyltransferase [Chloroflexota bacterium]